MSRRLRLLLLSTVVALPACDSLFGSDGDDPGGPEEVSAWANSLTLPDSAAMGDGFAARIVGLAGISLCYSFVGTDTSSEGGQWTLRPRSIFSIRGNCQPALVEFEQDVTVPTLHEGWNVVEVRSQTPLIRDSVWVKPPEMRLP